MDMRLDISLGRETIVFSCFPTLLDAQRKAGDNASAFFLGGYFRALFEGNVAEWEKQLDAPGWGYETKCANSRPHISFWNDSSGGFASS